MTCHRDKVRKTVGKVLKPRIPPYFLKRIVHKKSIKKLPLHAAVFRFFVKFWGAKVSMHSWRGHALNTVRVLFRCVC